MGFLYVIFKATFGATRFMDSAVSNVSFVSKNIVYSEVFLCTIQCLTTFLLRVGLRIDLL